MAPASKEGEIYTWCQLQEVKDRCASWRALMSQSFKKQSPAVVWTSRQIAFFVLNEERRFYTVIPLTISAKLAFALDLQSDPSLSYFADLHSRTAVPETETAGKYTLLCP